MMFHVSFGIMILVFIVIRFVWRITHPVAPKRSLPVWQRLTSEAVHWLLYALVLATTLSGWLLASQRGWSISLFFLVPLPMLTSQSSPIAGSIGGWHGHCLSLSEPTLLRQWRTSTSTVTGSCSGCFQSQEQS